MNLNIIGNGFDLYYGLPTSYYYFGCYLIETDIDFYHELSEMYGFLLGRYDNPIAHNTVYGVEDTFWKDFEEHLGCMEESWLENTLVDDLGLEVDDAIDLEMRQVDNSKEIKDKLQEWIKNTVNTKENFEIINREMRDKADEIHFEVKDCFVSFNYTDTLVKVHGIEKSRIYHIHGNWSDDDLIIGHGNNDAIRRLKDEARQYDGYEFDQESRNRGTELRCKLDNLVALRKDTGRCWNGCKCFLDGLRTIPDEIHVYGLSFGNVDIPYMQKIRGLYSDATWKISYHDIQQKSRMIEVAEQQLDLRKGEYELFELSNPYADIIKKQIVDKQGIVEYEKY